MPDNIETSVTYAVIQEDAWCAESEDLADAMHYVSEYEQNGPVELYEVITIRRIIYTTKVD